MIIFACKTSNFARRPLAAAFFAAFLVLATAVQRTGFLIPGPWGTVMVHLARRGPSDLLWGRERERENQSIILKAGRGGGSGAL